MKVETSRWDIYLNDDAYTIAQHVLTPAMSEFVTNFDGKKYPQLEKELPSEAA